MKCDCCDEKASWVRCTQFAGNHYFCDLHALQEEDFGQSDSYSFWSEHNYVEKNMKSDDVERMIDSAEKVLTKKLYVVDVVSTFRMRYVVEARSEEHALDEVTMEEHDPEFKEFSQEHIGTHIFASRELTKDQYLELFDKDNDYLKGWTEEQKLNFINKIDYQE
jgi:protein subunit release factor A